jgi:hypothetical protein
MLYSGKPDGNNGQDHRFPSTRLAAACLKSADQLVPVDIEQQLDRLATDIFRFNDCAIETRLDDIFRVAHPVEKPVVLFEETIGDERVAHRAAHLSIRSNIEMNRDAGLLAPRHGDLAATLPLADHLGGWERRRPRPQRQACRQVGDDQDCDHVP